VQINPAIVGLNFYSEAQSAPQEKFKGALIMGARPDQKYLLFQLARAVFAHLFAKFFRFRQLNTSVCF
jgi:hypothetical protein